MAAESCFSSLNCFVLFCFLFFSIFFLPTSWILLINNDHGLLTQSQLEGSETRGIILNTCLQKTAQKLCITGYGLGYNTTLGKADLKPFSYTLK